MDFDQILAKCGDFNRYQLLILALFGVVNVIVSMHYFTQTVISFVPDHWCYHEKLENKTFDEIATIYAKFPNPSCTKLEDIDGLNATVSTEKCSRWIYKYDFGYRSMNTELNWVCESSYKARIGQSLFFIGSVVGTLFYGLLSDKIGRLPALILSNLSGFIGDFSTIFTSSVTTFTLCRFISGLAADTNFYLMYIIVLEYIRPSMRTFGLNIAVGIFYTLGLVFTPWVAVLAGHWQYYLASTSIPILFITVYYFIVQESAQWLVTRNDVDGAIKRLKRVAKFNGRKVSITEFEEFRKYCEKQRQKQGGDDQKHSNLIDMFRTPRMRKHTLILFFKSMVITLCYDVVSRNVEGMGISPFIMFSLSALVVLPSSLILILLQDRIGRKGMASGSLLVGGFFTVASGIAIAYQQHNHNAILLACLTIASRFGVAISYESGSQYATELIPTCVRGQGVAAVHVAGFAASFLAPYILWLGTLFKAAPSIILGVLFFAGSLVCLLLPETLNRSLPKTLEEGEEFGKGESMFDFPCLSKNKSRSSDSDSEMEPYDKRKQSLTAGLEHGNGSAHVIGASRHDIVDDNSNSFLEYIRPSMRTFGLNIAVGIFYTLGLVFTPWVAVLAGHWQYYLASTSIPILFITVYYFIVQESAQWLVTRNDVDGAIKRLKRVAKFNGRKVSITEFEEFRKYCEKQRQKQGGDDQKHSNLIDMFRTPRMRKHTLILFFKSMVITLCYDVVSRNVEGMGISPFIMFSLSALVVLPSSLILILLQDRIGRKGMASGSLLVGGFFTVASGIAIAYQQHNHNAILLACLTIASRFGVAISYESGSQYATELIPTCVRGQGVAAVHVAGFAASFLAPYILWLGTLFKAAPSIILGVLFFAGSLVCLLLPETLNRSLPKTLEEGEEFGKGESMFDFPCLSKNKSRSSDSDSEMEPYDKRKQSLTAGLEHGNGSAHVIGASRHDIVDDNSNSCT